MSKGIRIYWHDSYGEGHYRRTRECHNYWTGQEAVEDVLADKTCKILAVGTEEGAMVIHYKRV